MFEYPDEVVVTFTTIFVGAVWGFLPVLSIGTLYFLKTPVAKIGAIISFISIFLLVIIITIKYKWVELCVATAA